MYYSIGIHIALILGILALSTSAIFVKIASAPSAITSFYRLFFSAVLLLPFALASKRSRTELLNLPMQKVLLGILAYFILNETISLQQFVGIAVILAGLEIFFTTKKDYQSKTTCHLLQQQVVKFLFS